MGNCNVHIETPRRVLTLDIMGVPHPDGSPISEFICALESSNDTEHNVPVFAAVAADDFPYFNCEDPEAALKAVQDAILAEVPDAGLEDKVIISVCW